VGRRGLTGGGVLAACALVAILLLQGGGSDDASTTTNATTSTTEATAAIGGEEGAAIATTLELVDAGGPFPHDQDGATFQNREGLLPDQPQGYYREYTVETPGSDDRGARRLVIGDGGETYYTRDHYESFEPIEPEEYT
jgi:ribonuclease T1